MRNSTVADVRDGPLEKLWGEGGEFSGAFHLGKKPGNFGGSKSGISDW